MYTRSRLLLLSLAMSAGSWISPISPISPAAAQPAPAAAPPAAPAKPPAAPAKPPAPPSTGKELPAAGPRMPSVKEAENTLAAALAEAMKPAPNCGVVANAKTRLAWMMLPVPPAKVLVDNAAAFVAFARCAEKERFYLLEKDLGYQLIKAGAGHAELLARALIGVRDLKAAATVLDQALKATPKDANLLVTAAKLECMVDAWKACIGHAGTALTESTKLDVKERVGVQSRALKYAARAALHLGALDKAQRFAAQSEKVGGDKADLNEIRSLIAQADLNKALIEPQLEAELPLGIYHLYGKVPDAGPLLKLLVTNLGAKPAQFKAEVVIDGVTQKAIQNAIVGKSQSQLMVFNPPLATGFDPSTVRALKASQIAVKVSVGGKLVYEETLPVNLQPRDFLPTVAYSGKDAEHRTPWFYGAWITPNAKAVDSFLQKAKARAPRATFSGEQSDTFPQVKAIYDELQAEGMSYVMDPEVLANDAFGQRTRLPSEILATTNAQCLEGALLYATLLEAIGLRPVVVRVPGHAFVGWRPSDKDKLKAKLPKGVYFLETTATHDATFEQAVTVAIGEYEEHDKKHEATVVDVGALRKAGVTPQPID